MLFSSEIIKINLSLIVGNKALKLLKLRRFSLVVILFTWVLIALIGGFSLFLWHSADVEKLIGYYPYFDIKTQEYSFTSDRPKDWVSINDVSRYAKWAIVVSEDWAFYEHNGIDLNQLRIVIGESIKQGKFVRGASTITQQVIKNTMLSNERSLWRKFREMIMSYKLERVMNKDQILEIYLNIIELGKDLYGVSKASRHYFNKPPSELSAREGAFLAMLLPSPVKYGTSFRRKELTAFAREVIDSILVKLRQADVYEEEQRIIESQKLFYWETRKLTEDKDSSDLDEVSDHLDFEVYE